MLMGGCKKFSGRELEVLAMLKGDVTLQRFRGDVFCGSNLENRDGLGAVTGVP